MFCLYEVRFLHVIKPKEHCNGSNAKTDKKYSCLILSQTKKFFKNVVTFIIKFLLVSYFS